jgi:hypothetical protein
MPDAKSFGRAMAAVLFLLTGGCVAMKPPARNGGPALSSEKIQLAVLGQSCSQTQEPDEYGWDLVEEDVEVGVRNDSTEPATVHPDRFRLLTPDGYALRTITWRSADPLQVPGGANERFALRFMTRGGLECRKEMRLDPDAGITLRERPVALEPVSFTPDRSL